MYYVLEIPDCNICFTPLDERGHPDCNHKHEKFMQTVIPS